MVALNNVYQSQDNYQTGLRVEHALIRSYPDRFLQVNASAFYGIVELSGTIVSSQDKYLAIEIAERVPGVTTVVESLRVAHTTMSSLRAARLQEGIRSRKMGHRGRDSALSRWNND